MLATGLLSGIIPVLNFLTENFYGKILRIDR
jgi:hypothetical protein